MEWTDERVELLKKLWQDGLSASQIAKQFGGFTRNAVIGKVHRLGLSGRTDPKIQRQTYVKASRPARPVATASAAPRRVAEPTHTAVEKCGTLAPARVCEAIASPASQVVPVRYVEEALGTATILTLGDHMCRWPIGDPSEDNFTFCGRYGFPYCFEHAQVAYQPAKKRTGSVELARSLRHYI